MKSLPVRILVTVGAVLAIAVALAIDAVAPESLVVMPLFAFGSSIVLVLGAKAFGTHLVSRPAGTRPGELGKPADDLDGPDDPSASTSEDGPHG